MKKFMLFATLVGMVLFSVSCQNPEDVTISKYFEAMKHGEQGDRDTMNSMSIDPKFIQFQEYEIVSVQPAREIDLQLAGLETKLSEVTESRKKQAKVAEEANDSLEDLKYELDGAARGAKRQELEGKLKVAEERKKVEEDKFKQFTAQIGSLKKMIEFEKNLINLSANVQENHDFYTGKVIYSEVLVKTTANDGANSEYVFLLTKYDLAMEGKPLPRSRYIILSILPAAEAAKAEKPEDHYKKTISGSAPIESSTEPVN